MFVLLIYFKDKGHSRKVVQDLTVFQRLESKVETDKVPHKRRGVEWELSHWGPPGGSGGRTGSDRDGLPLTCSFVCTHLQPRNRAAQHAPRLTPGKRHKSASECSRMALLLLPSLQSWHLSPFKACTFSVTVVESCCVFIYSHILPTRYNLLYLVGRIY